MVLKKIVETAYVKLDPFDDKVITFYELESGYFMGKKILSYKVLEKDPLFNWKWKIELELEETKEEEFLKKWKEYRGLK